MRENTRKGGKFTRGKSSHGGKVHTKFKSGHRERKPGVLRNTVALGKVLTSLPMRVASSPTTLNVRTVRSTEYSAVLCQLASVGARALPRLHATPSNRCTERTTVP